MGDFRDGIREAPAHAWRPIDTAPKTGVRIEVGHSKAPGYIGTGSWAGYRWSCSIAFIEPGRSPLMHWQPDIWRPTSEQAQTLADAHSKSDPRPEPAKEG